MKPIFTNTLDENQLAQEINSIEEIDNNNPEPVIEITPSTPITIEDMIEPIPESVIERQKNTVRYINSGFTF